MPNHDEYKKLITEIIQKQMVILGPDIALIKARNTPNSTIDGDGKVTGITGAPQESLQSIINEYVSLSGEIVKKTMEPLMAKYPNLISKNDVS